MEYLVAAPELLATTAADVGEIGSAITDANASAAGPTAGLVAAAKDEVSEAIAKLFGEYGQQYQAVLTKAAAFHDDFTRALAAAGNAYAQAEASTAALLTGGTPGALNALGTLGTSAVTGFANPSAQQVVALIMGGTWNPLPDPVYLGNVNLVVHPAALPRVQSAGPTHARAVLAGYPPTRQRDVRHVRRPGCQPAGLRDQSPTRPWQQGRRVRLLPERHDRHR